MCTVNHHVLARPGYLIDTPMESMAATGHLFSRMLHHAPEVRLDAQQVMDLLTISKEYHDKQVALRIEFGKVTEKLEIKWGRVTAEDVANRQELLTRHAELLREEEELFFVCAARGHELLTDEQIEAAEAIYHAEKNEMLTALAASLDNAVAPAFTFRALVPELTAAAPEVAEARS